MAGYFNRRGEAAEEGREALNLPPPYKLVTLRENGDAFAHAKAIAAESGAGTLVWVRRFDTVEFALVLEPEEALATARRAFLAGMNALGDALAAQSPPEKPLSFGWPGSITLDGGLIGGGRLGWPGGAREDGTPDWLVFGVMITAERMEAQGLEALLRATSLVEEGIESVDAGAIVESFSRHLMAGFDAWQERGFDAVSKAYLERLAIGKAGDLRRIDERGDLFSHGPNETGEGRRLPLREALLGAPAWLDPKTGQPR